MMRQNDNITVMQKRDDQEMITLLLAFEEGDATAFSKLYDLNVNLLFSYGCKLTTDRELLKDCIHDVFVKMYTKKEELNPVSCEDVENNYLEREREHVNNKLVKHLLAQLSPRQREALILYYIEERKYEDICQIMNMNYQSVRNLMHRGLSKLKTIAG